YQSPGKACSRTSEMRSITIVSASRRHGRSESRLQRLLGAKSAPQEQEDEAVGDAARGCSREQSQTRNQQEGECQIGHESKQPVEREEERKAPRSEVLPQQARQRQADEARHQQDQGVIGLFEGAPEDKHDRPVTESEHSGRQ